MNVLYKRNNRRHGKRRGKGWVYKQGEVYGIGVVQKDKKVPDKPDKRRRRRRRRRRKRERERSPEPDKEPDKRRPKQPNKPYDRPNYPRRRIKEPIRGPTYNPFKPIPLMPDNPYVSKRGRKGNPYMPGSPLHYLHEVYRNRPVGPDNVIPLLPPPMIPEFGLPDIANVFKLPKWF